MKKLAIVTSHPIQYNAPWFRLLAAHAGIRLKVFYTWSQSEHGSKYDPGFKKNIEWDIPLLDGYEFSFVKNISPDPGTHHFRGIINPTLNKEIEAWKPDAVFVFGWSFHSHLQCMRYFHKKIPVLFRGDSTLIDEKPGLKRWIRRFFLKWVYRHIDYALFVGTENRKYFITHGLKQEQLVFAPHAIDNNRFSDPSGQYLAEAVAWRKKIGIGERDFVVLLAGKLEPKKNPFYLFELADKMENQDIKFLIVGNGELEEELKAKAVNKSNFIFLDFQNQQKMPVVYRLANIFILPSKGPGETWGLAVNEAMACGKPVAVSDKAGCAIDLVPDNANGIIFDISETERCSSLINNLQKSKSLENNMGISSEKIISYYSFETIINGVCSVLKITG